MKLRLVALGGLGALMGLLGCLGPNPLIDAGEHGSESATSDNAGDGESGDGDPGDGDPGDGDPGDGDPDPGHCDNGMLDGNETDLDCGGSCSACEQGSACEIGDDCQSLVCDADECAAPSCIDDVENGDELEVDCGGSCRFCAHSPYVAQLDDFPGAHVGYPDVAMFEDGVFAVTYSSYATSEIRVRWFDEFAVPLGGGVTTGGEFMLSDVRALIASEDLDTHNLYAVLTGLDAMSSSRDAFSIRLGPDTPASSWPIYFGPAAVNTANGVLDGDIATFVWLQDGQVFLRRYNYALDIPVAVASLANPDFAQRPAGWPVIALRNGVSVVAWVACDAMDPNSCDIELRSSDFGWIEDAPVQVSLPPEKRSGLKLAIAEDDRVGLIWTGGASNDRKIWAAQLNPELAPDGAPWLLQDSIPSIGYPNGDVAALEDGTFAFAWPDSVDKRVHIRRFSGPELPLVTDVGDEAPWPASELATQVHMSASGNLLTVVWLGGVNNLVRLQGQVLSY
ncbi:hypothetical protein [Enhygromyxa salina]|nr:hypothetical protein [Enhygromyxa salina]